MSALLDALHADPWAQDFLDLATLNARASGAVEAAIEAVHRTARSAPQSLRSTSLVILGPPGAGKTHLFARLRRKVGPRAVFVHVRPLVHAEMNARFLLGEVVRQLGFPTSQGMPQASALVGSLLGYLGGVGAGFPSTVLAEYADLPADAREERLDAALERLFALWPELDESYLRRLLAVPFASTQATTRALLTWLSGRDCDVAQLQRIGATGSLGEEHAFAALRTLAAVAALGSPLVIVFDQLENLIDAEGAGPRLRAYAHLAAECVDTLRGTVVVHLALDSEWQRGIEPAFNLSQRSRIVMARELLELPRAAEREELLRRFHERLPGAQPFPWPLGERRLERLRNSAGITPRMLLIELRRALDGEVDEAALEEAPGPSEPGAAAARVPQPEQRELDGEWQVQLQTARELLLRASEERQPLDAARLADGIFACAPFLPQLALRAGGKPPAQLLLERNGRGEALALVQESHPRSAGTVLTKLAALSQSTPVVAVRERAREFPPTWKETLRKQAALLETGRARWVDLEPEDGARLLALAALLQAARSGDVSDGAGAQVTEAEVVAWARGALDIADWPIARALEGAAETAPAVQPEGMEEEEPAASSVPAAPASSPPSTDPLPPPALGAQPLPQATGSSLAILRRLRVASFERLVREVVRVEPASTRATIQAELEAAGERIRWFGRSIVFFRSGE